MPAIITNLSRMQRTIDFYNKATNGTSDLTTLYLGIGKTTPWENENSPDTPNINETEIENLQLIKRINKTSNANIFLIKYGGKILITLDDTNQLEEEMIVYQENTYGKILNIDNNNIIVETYEGHWKINNNIYYKIDDIEYFHTINNVDEEYFLKTFYFRNTCWEKITVNSVSPNDPQLYDYWLQTTVLKKFDGNDWVVVDDIFPNHVYIKVILYGNYLPNDISYRQIGVIENFKINNNLIYDDYVDVTNITDNYSYILHYLNNISPIQRNQDQNEEINILIEF